MFKRPEGPGVGGRLGRGVLASILVAWLAACADPQPPTACGAIPQVTVNAGEQATATACFNDPNGDMLTYSVSSGNPGVATATISGTTVTVTAVAPGNASVTVTASDPGGLQAEQSFQVMVPNRSPEPRGTIAPITVQAGHTESVDVASYFTEPDGEALTYSAASSNPAVATVSVAGSTVSVAALARGTTTVTVTATDPGGLSATQDFASTVPNRSPESVGTIPDETVEVGEPVTVDVSSYFEDPDGDALTYTARSSNTNVARVSISGSIATVTAIARGTADVTVTATDSEGLSATQTFESTVPNRGPEAVGSIPAAELTEGDTTSVGLSARFSDPDGDPLSYAVVSSNEVVITVSVSSDAVVLAANAEGTASVTVTATDPGGLTATQTFDVTVSARATIYNAGETIPTLPTGHWIPDFNHAVKYFYSDRVTVRFEHLGYIEENGTRYTCIRSAGCTIVDRTVTAGPIRAGKGEHSGDNHQPVATRTIPDRQLWTGRTIAVNASTYFVEPNDDPMTYTVASSNAGAATADVSGHTVTISAQADGSPTITITASDPGGLTATQEFVVTVKRNVAPATVGAIPAATLTVGQPPVSVDISAYFSDPGDTLTYTAATSNAAVATVSVSGSSVKVSTVAEGSSTVTVTASDPSGLEAHQQWAVTVTPNSDRAALVAFYEAAGGDNWGANGNWLTDAPLGDWHGVQVNRSGRVVSLDLYKNNLKGRISPEIGNLTALETLNLGRNWRPGPSSIGLTGPIPSEIGNLSKLSDLNLSSNELTGRIPVELGGLSNLARLDLGWNDLTGPIPVELTQLDALTKLDLIQNNLTGTIPPGIGDMVSLTDLNLGNNGLSGEIPAELGNLSLTNLFLDYNALEGPIPAELANISTLRILYLRENRLTGPLPSELGNLTRLLALVMNNNRLTGAIPVSYLDLDLSYFFVADNQSVCMPDTTDFADWLASINHNDGPYPACSG
ncbi:MAG: hypothetical protein F4139_11480 [Gemmatimonadetes bacterium]|nr:hypothetical protein [Gemmatimonadota bacterium]MYK67294.1 hypothetical protein [Gemmatimonadota bacterium]